MTQPESIDFFDLSNRIAIAKSFGFSTKALETQFHSLLSLPLLLVAMTLIAATVSLKFSRFNQSRSVILGGILSGFVLYVVTVLVKAFGSSGSGASVRCSLVASCCSDGARLDDSTSSGGRLVAAGNRKHIRKLVAALAHGRGCVGVHGVSPIAASPRHKNDGAPMLWPLLKLKVPEDAKMLLSANELVYNQDAESVIVRGAVQINYGGYQMVAQQVEYNQKTGRIIATGEIELIEPGGNRIYADKMDVTDNFGNGFIDALRIETTDLTKLAAETAANASAATR